VQQLSLSTIWLIHSVVALLQFGARSVFLSTEDESAVTELVRKWNSSYDFYFTKVPRYNTSPWQSIELIGGPDQELQVSLAQLFLAVECDFFVGTRTSNWCRLIDELRKVNGKARTAYLSPANDRDFE